MFVKNAWHKSLLHNPTYFGDIFSVLDNNLSNYYFVSLRTCFIFILLKKKTFLKNVWCGKLAAFISEVTRIKKTLKRHDQMFSFGEI
jgi:hypothetical protein